MTSVATVNQRPIGSRRRELLDPAALAEVTRHRTAWVVYHSVTSISGYLISVGLALYIDRWFAWIAEVFASGFFLLTCTFATHYCVHRSYVRSRKANELAGRIWAGAIMLNFSDFKRFHLTHHADVGGPKDPDRPSHLQTIGDYVIKMATHAVDLPLRGWRALLFGKFEDYANSESARRAVIRDQLSIAVWTLALIVGLLLWPIAIILGYLVPLILCWTFWPFLTSLSEHMGTEITSDPLRNSRSVTSSRLAQFLLWNECFHAEHHAVPRSRFYNLHKVHALIGARLKYKETSFLRFHLKTIRRLWKGKRLDGAAQ